MKTLKSLKKVNKGKVATGTAKAGALTAYHVISLIFRAVVTVVLILITTCMVFACFFIFYVKMNLTPQLDISFEDYSINQTSEVYYTDSETGEYVKLCDIQGDEDRKWISYDEMTSVDGNKYIEHAAVAIEDKRFYEHNGVDWYRTVAAFFNMFLSNSSTFGGSTITQQLIKNITQENDDTIPRKLVEIFRALELEQNYKKENIMEWYLNVVYFGRGRYGIAAAANYYFDKEANELTPAEAATIIAITNNPYQYDPYSNFENNTARKNNILEQMYLQEYLTLEQYEEALEQEITLVSHTITTIVDGAETTVAEENYYSWFVDALIEDVIVDLMELRDLNYENAEALLISGGFQIYSTMDFEAQEIVDTYYENLDNFRTYTSQQLQSAIVITDPYSGDIIALSGGVGEKNGSRLFNRATEAQRSPGSSIKPLTAYSLAIELGYVTPDTYIEDSDLVQLEGYPNWLPRNDNRSYRGIVTISQALISSINTVAVQLVDMVTPSYVYNFMIEKLHFTTFVEEDCDYAPLGLGAITYGVTVREMAAAFGIFPNSGIYTETRLYSEIYSPEGELIFVNEPETNTAISDTTAYHMTRMMHNAASYGTGYEASFAGMPVAGKTGTGANNNDRWFCGFTPYYVAAVWVGYDRQTSISWSGNPAAQIFRKLMSQIHADLEYKDFSVPASTYLTPVEGVDREREYTVRCVTDTGVVLQEETEKALVGTTISMSAPEIEGYTFKETNPDAKLDIEVHSNNPDYTWPNPRTSSGNTINLTVCVHTELNVIEFVYTVGESEEPDDPPTSSSDDPSTSDPPTSSSDDPSTSDPPESSSSDTSSSAEPPASSSEEPVTHQDSSSSSSSN